MRDGSVITRYAQSAFGEAHTEEKLVAIATELGANLAVAPNAALTRGHALQNFIPNGRPVLRRMLTPPVNNGDRAIAAIIFRPLCMRRSL